MPLHSKSRRHTRCTKRHHHHAKSKRHVGCKKHSQHKKQTHRQRRRKQTGGNIRAGSRFPETFYTAQTQMTDTHTACAHAKWTGEI